jgi:ribonucleoside-diphosphate reductase alpha chain
LISCQAHRPYSILLSLRSQLSSCYLTTIPDDLDGIYEGLKENALLSKFAGGLGNDWTNVQCLGQPY